jgi:hypothetical protein
MPNDAPKQLESISVRQHQHVHHGKVQYRVYSKEGHFVLVEANSAHEAYARAGIAKPFKIQREFFFTKIAVAKEELIETQAPVEMEVKLPTEEELSVRIFIEQEVIDEALAAQKQPFEPLEIDLLARQMEVVNAHQESEQSFGDSDKTDLITFSNEEDIKQTSVQELEAVVAEEMEEVAIPEAENLSADEVNSLLFGQGAAGD